MIHTVREAEAYAVEECRNMYTLDNQMMRSVAGIIAMTAIDKYKQKCREIKKRNRSGVDK